ncbi:type VI secretion system Vgr family protein [Variovorax atrisoli]|uniref:type VI secretion system Vgr family protein n=1 Tax=Variovorax atrisoli TaxID=3394203 RepID=UPI00161D3426|nr:type VI secretion system tip protein TssI/VgrG [Variovorax sp. BK613]MBB3639990.1 type VI secretion system secreted protein VgrG [Variovorax sp. BK613]
MADNEFRIESDSPAKDDLMFWRIVGHEALARPSAYELTVLSTNKAIDAKDILGHAFDVVIGFKDADGGSHERHCQGHAVRFVRSGHMGRHYEYRITLRSWFWLLTKRRNSRILQEKKVLEVLDAVFEDSPIKRFKKTKADNVVGTHNPRRYCVQHQESDYGFLSRLLEDEGIYYWFDAHDAPGTMHLSDASDMAHEKLPAADTLRHMALNAAEPRFNEISRWVSGRQFDTGKHSSRDSDFKAIKKKLGSDIDASAPHELAGLEIFEFPGGYFTGDDAENRAKLRGDELNARRDRHWAITTWPDVTAGRGFTFEGDPDGTRNGDYIIAACTFVASHRGYEGVSAATVAQPVRSALAEALRDDAVNADTLQVLEELIAVTPALHAAQTGSSAFLLTVIPADRMFRTPRLTPRVTMPGPQTAIVVGPKGDELHVDDHGRVKVHFLWDRYDESNEKSTCWVRVSQPWAGKGWGGYFAPRIGQEVIVDFLNGDPDRPVIVGRVYNDDQPIPYKSPTQSGFRTRSTPGGGVNNYNEIMFEDKKGSEALNIHAEKNMGTVVENDQSLTVQNDRTVTVEGKESYTVLKTQMNHVVKAQTNKFDDNTFTTTLGNQTIGTKGTQSTVVNGAVSVHTNATYALTSVGAYSQTSQSITINSVGAVSLTSGASVAMASVGAMKMTTNADRTDASAGSHSIFSNAIKAVSNSDLNLIAVGNINATSAGSNTTVLGANSSGYIGVNSEANMGMARSTFMGLSIDTMMGLSMASCLALQMETAAALKLGFAGVDLSISPVDVEQRQAKVIMPGGGAGGGAGGAFAMGASIGAAIGAVAYSAVSSVVDVNATYEQYENASKALNEAAEQAQALGLSSLSARLAAAKSITDARRDRAWYNPDNMRLHSDPADRAAAFTTDGNPQSAPVNAVSGPAAPPGSTVPAPPMPVSTPAAAGSQPLPSAPE